MAAYSADRWNQSIRIADSPVRFTSTEYSTLYDFVDQISKQKYKYSIKPKGHVPFFWHYIWFLYSPSYFWPQAFRQKKRRSSLRWLSFLPWTYLYNTSSILDTEVHFYTTSMKQKRSSKTQPWFSLWKRMRKAWRMKDEECRLDTWDTFSRSEFWKRRLNRLT